MSVRASGVELLEATPDSASCSSSARLGVRRARMLAVLNAVGGDKAWSVSGGRGEGRCGRLLNLLAGRGKFEAGGGRSVLSWACEGGRLWWWAWWGSGCGRWCLVMSFFSFLVASRKQQLKNSNKRRRGLCYHHANMNMVMEFSASHRERYYTLQDIKGGPGRYTDRHITEVFFGDNCIT